jgi:hypothetical protein
MGTGRVTFGAGGGLRGNVFVNGNVGIGITNPTCALDVSGAVQISGGTAWLKSTGTNNLYIGGSASFLIQQDAANNKLFITRNSNYDMTILGTNGNVGINTILPSQLLDVNGTCKINSLLIPGTNVIEFGSGVAGKDTNAGKIGYTVFSTGLDIVGAGTTNGSRLVKIYDLLNVVGDITSGGTITSSSIITSTDTNNGFIAMNTGYTASSLYYTGYAAFHCRSTSSSTIKRLGYVGNGYDGDYIYLFADGAGSTTYNCLGYRCNKNFVVDGTLTANGSVFLNGSSKRQPYVYASGQISVTSVGNTGQRDLVTGLSLPSGYSYWIVSVTHILGTQAVTLLPWGYVDGTTARVAWRDANTNNFSLNYVVYAITS